MNTRVILMTLAVAMPALAFGQNTVTHNCSLGELTRRVEILYEPGRVVPCEVHYYKDAEALEQREVLWSAANQEGYCEQKTDEFIAQLEEWGWQCGSIDISRAEPAVAVDDAPVATESDDTEALAPAAEAGMSESETE